MIDFLNEKFLVGHSVGCSQKFDDPNTGKWLFNRVTCFHFFTFGKAAVVGAST